MTSAQFKNMHRVH